MIQAVKIVDGKEVEWIDPCLQIRFNEDSFIICNEAHGYAQPLEEWELWTIRKTN